LFQPQLTGSKAAGQPLPQEGRGQVLPSQVAPDGRGQVVPSQPAHDGRGQVLPNQLVLNGRVQDVGTESAAAREEIW
jgi:hypothetical protein